MDGPDWVDDNVQALYVGTAMFGAFGTVVSNTSGILKKVAVVPALIGFLLMLLPFDEISLPACLRVIAVGTVAAVGIAIGGLIAMPLPEPLSTVLRGGVMTVGGLFFVPAIFALMFGLPTIAYRKYVRGEDVSETGGGGDADPGDRTTGGRRTDSKGRSRQADRSAPITRSQDDTRDRGREREL